jgi:ATP-binding cassette subfamily F protein 3
MLLDEPTNHLDVYTREALEEALERFTGALVVVSHDRYFIDRLAENIILVEDGHAEVYAGNYTDLVERMKAGIALPPPLPAGGGRRAAGGTATGGTAAGGTAVSGTPAQRTDQKKRDKRIKKIDEEIDALEQRIAAAERERERNDLLLCSEEVYRDGERMKKIQAQNADLKAMADLLYRKWEALAKEKEELQAAAVES